MWSYSRQYLHWSCIGNVAFNLCWFVEIRKLLPPPMRYGTGADSISAISIGITGTRGWTHSRGRVSAARASTADESSPKFSLTTITLDNKREGGSGRKR